MELYEYMADGINLFTDGSVWKEDIKQVSVLSLKHKHGRVLEMYKLFCGDFSAGWSLKLYDYSF